MRVLIACEFSGRVREAFRKRGHYAMSCDWAYDTEIPGPHYKGDVRDVLDDRWDLMVAHPDCTYHANSGVQWFTNIPAKPKAGTVYGVKRFGKLADALDFFLMLQGLPIPKIAIENPIPHHYTVDMVGKYTQLIQPYQFGDPESKATCLWLKGLPPLKPTRIVPKHLRKQSTHTASPGPNRAHERSRTFPGIARAMAQQWG